MLLFSQSYLSYVEITFLNVFKYLFYFTLNPAKEITRPDESYEKNPRMEATIIIANVNNEAPTLWWGSEMLIFCNIEIVGYLRILLTNATVPWWKLLVVVIFN